MQCVTGNLTGLCVQGSATPAELQDAWEDIYFEYLDLTGSDNTVYLNNLRKDLALLTDELVNIQCAVEYLRPAFQVLAPDSRAQLIGIIRRYDYPMSDDPGEEELEATLNRIAPKKLKLDTKIKELETFMANSGTRVVADEVYFINVLLTLSKDQGYAVRAKDISTLEYVLLLKNYLKKIEDADAREDI